jgi:hypothetical protein
MKTLVLASNAMRFSRRRRPSGFLRRDGIRLVHLQRQEFGGRRDSLLHSGGLRDDNQYLPIVQGRVVYEAFVQLLGSTQICMVPLTPPTQQKNMHGQFLWYPLRPSPLPGIARSTTENAHHDAKRKRDGCWHVLSNRVRDEENDMEKVQK